MLKLKLFEEFISEKKLPKSMRDFINQKNKPVVVKNPYREKLHKDFEINSQDSGVTPNHMEEVMKKVDIVFDEISKISPYRLSVGNSSHYNHMYTDANKKPMFRHYSLNISFEIEHDNASIDIDFSPKTLKVESATVTIDSKSLAYDYDDEVRYGGYKKELYRDYSSDMERVSNAFIKSNIVKKPVGKALTISFEIKNGNIDYADFKKKIKLSSDYIYYSNQ